MAAVLDSAEGDASAGIASSAERGAGEAVQAVAVRVRAAAATSIRRHTKDTEFEAKVVAAKNDYVRQARLRHWEKALGKIEDDLCDYGIEEAQRHPLNKLRIKLLNDQLIRIREMSGRRETLGLHPFCLICGGREPCLSLRRKARSAPAPKLPEEFQLAIAALPLGTIPHLTLNRGHTGWIQLPLATAIP